MFIYFIKGECVVMNSLSPSDNFSHYSRIENGIIQKMMIVACLLTHIFSDILFKNVLTSKKISRSSHTTKLIQITLIVKWRQIAQGRFTQSTPSSLWGARGKKFILLQGLVVNKIVKKKPQCLIVTRGVHKGNTHLSLVELWTTLMCAMLY